MRRRSLRRPPGRPAPLPLLARPEPPSAAPGRVTRELLERLHEDQLRDLERRLTPEQRARMADDEARMWVTVPLALHHGVPGVAEQTGLSATMPPRDIHAMSHEPEATGGSTYYGDLVADSLKEAGAPLAPRDRVLDFGCSSGRVVRVLHAWQPDATYLACDPNEAVIDWARAHLPGIQFFASPLDPPLPVPEASLDVVFAISIWSHFESARALRWLEEMYRVLRPGGVLLLTTHGWSSVAAHAREQGERWASRIAGELYAEGYSYVDVFGPEGDWGVPADGWGMAFLTAEWLTSRLTPGWDVALCRPGRVERNQDLYVLRRATDSAAAPHGSWWEDTPADDRELARRFGTVAVRAQALEAEVAARDREVEQLRTRIARVDNSIIWQSVLAARRAVYGRVGEYSRVARVISATLRGVAAVARGRSARLPSPPAGRRAPLAPIATIPPFAEPEVSLILPVHSQPDLTTACVRALAATATVPYELIVVDDTAVASVKEVVSRIEGASVIVNDENAGYTRSLNRGASVARGRFLVLLNDDTVPAPGWIDAMLECARASDDVGIVVPMYLDQAGLVKEAGAIVWRDGAADHFGAGDPDPDRSRYRYRREVDYGSGACLMIRADLFRRIGGLDESFSPAYYEDVDLCFAAREAGARVMYEPRARVMHVEGATAGTDVTVGAKRFQVSNREVFVQKWRRRLECYPGRGSDAPVTRPPRDAPHVLIADDQVPRHDQDGGSRRMRKLIEAFQSLGCMVTFLPAAGDPVEPYATELEDRGVEVLRRPTEVEPEIAALGPGLALAVLSRPHVASRYLQLVREHAPGATVAYDTVDVHYLRERRRADVEGIAPDRRIDAIRELELAMVRACDVTIAVTDDDREELRRAVPTANVVVIPTIEEPHDNIPGAAGRSGIVFVGNFQHMPNVDAATFLVDGVMPDVWRERPEVPVKVVGASPPPEVQALASHRVEVTGWVDDLTRVLHAARVAVAPLRYGAGLKLKNVEAMAHGVPTVTTTVGAQGIGADGATPLVVADDAPDIAGHVLALIADDDLWQRTSDAALAFTRDRYAPEVIAPALRALLRAASIEPKKRASG